jgi:Ca-activated chloride channel homolog
MPKRLANRERARRDPFRQLLLVTLAALCFTVVVIAQQQQQQRPRRVGDGAKTKAPAAQTPSQPKPSASPATSEEVDDNDVVRVETQLVSVPAIVMDAATGHPVAGLSAGNFVLYEDGRPQQIANFGTTDAPFEVALLLDTSGSTRADVALIRSAANAFVSSLRTGDRVAIIAYNTSQYNPNKLATVDVLAQLTSNRQALREAIEDIGSSNGTPFYDSLARIVADVFREPPREELRGRRAVVALTDGVDSSSNSDYAEVRSRLLHSGIACYFIQVNTEDFVEDRLMGDCQSTGTIHLSRAQLERYRRIFAPRIDAAHFEDFCGMGPFERMQISRDLYTLARQEMDELARSSGGKTFPVTNLRDARAAFARVALEIGTQYSLGYYPTNKTRDGRYRAIRVEIKGVPGSAQIRARDGYYAPKG